MRTIIHLRANIYFLSYKYLSAILSTQPDSIKLNDKYKSIVMFLTCCF